MHRTQYWDTWRPGAAGGAETERPLPRPSMTPLSGSPRPGDPLPWSAACTGQTDALLNEATKKAAFLLACPPGLPQRAAAGPALSCPLERPVWQRAGQNGALSRTAREEPVLAPPARELARAACLRGASDGHGPQPRTQPGAQAPDEAVPGAWSLTPGRNRCWPWAANLCGDLLHGHR